MELFIFTLLVFFCFLLFQNKEKIIGFFSKKRPIEDKTGEIFTKRKKNGSPRRPK